MKKVFYKLVIILFVLGIIALAGCDKDEVGFTDGLWLKMGDKSIVSTSDIDFYDVSTHMIYLKKKLPYLEKIGYGGGMMSVHVGKDEIYKCPFHSLLSSSMPQGVLIYGPPFNTEDMIHIGFIQIRNANNELTVTDPRSDKRIITALKKYGQYHEGLHCEIQSCNYSEGKLVLHLVLSNPDTFDYYYLDPSKMGLRLFHYFTNGPTFWAVSYTKSYTHQETIIRPEPWDSWEREWLTRIKSGEHKNISITYNHFELMPAGQYRMYFEFPGLNYGISQKDLTLQDGRIWMGSLNIEKDVTIH
jgi:hypothetical protein